MKKYVLFASAILAFASCASDSFTGTEEAGRVAQGEKPISFGFDVPAATRASGAEAATKLNNQFIVYAEKNESGKAAPATGNLVINNYVVNFVDNSAYTTTSNTQNWEYVGFKLDDNSATIPTTTYSTNITPNSGTDGQTIKYWDYAATSYTFTAVSAKPADINSGAVKITKTTAGTNDEYEKGYSVTVTDEADLSSLYFADRVNIAKTTTYDRTQPNKYGGNVTFTFRNGVSQVRVGMYETIPGYEVKVTKFYYADAAAPAFTAMTTENTANFVANVPNVSPASGKTSVPGTFTVKYYPQSTGNDAAGITNHPTISFTADPATGKKNYLSLGTGVYNTILATTSATPTYDQTAGAFTTVFPQEDNATNMKLKVDYTLYNEVTKETIEIKGKTAEVPGQYLAWKPNFKYTYLFKITDDDLYPITFDAVVVEAEDGKAEYITTVTEPSITTFGVKGDKYVAGKDEYETGTDIYATIVKNHSVVDPMFMTRTHLYKVTSSDLTNFPVTEAAVAEALAESPTGTAKISCTHICTPWKNSSDKATQVTSVPSEDGSTITQNAVKFSPASGDEGYYAIQYIDETSTITYEAVTLNVGDPVKGYYTEDSGNYTPTTDTTAQTGVTYYRQNVTGGHPVYKVIKVVAVP